MLDKQVVKEFLLEEFKEREWAVPKTVKMKELVDVFCQFTEDDYYEWLKDNFASFFNDGDPDWGWVKSYIKKHKKEW
jgi:hypothetical protein